MPELYLSEKTITESYQTLTKEKFNFETEFFYFLILKHAGLSQHNFIKLTEESVKQKIIEATTDLAFLFLSEERFHNKKAKNNFINPFAMQSWKNQPSEPIKSWAPARLVNNVTGGGKQWKKILVDDGSDANTVKLKHDYVNFFSGLSSTFPLDAISVWVSKFNIFDQEVPLSSLIGNFYKYFNITDEEKKYFFSTQENVSLSFSDVITDPNIIRELIGTPQGNSNWLVESKEMYISNTSDLVELMKPFGSTTKYKNAGIKTIQHYKHLLEKANQAIFMGPPGTSKSYIANEMAKEFDYTKRIQFHPQYSYQNFIGGKILEGGRLEDKKGEFIEFLERAMGDINKRYLLVIEEINRANVSQVFGELIQLLDRGESLELTYNGVTTRYTLPENIKIVGTMNTTDRTVGRIDYAIKRRFYQVYFGVDYGILIDKIFIEGNKFSVTDLMRKINNNLYESLSNKEMVIGHAVFMKEFCKDAETGKYIWTADDFSDLFNYVVVPIVEDYCNGNVDLIVNVIGEKLQQQITDSDFVEAIQEFLNQ
ncbi:McrB family protein [Salipaludibacillus sp. HK11]|uniref:McrB family protein n=1 Tax=Salipaludibacillus sp. HK11 TaxID=3394320 RepID=UPI0039FD6504